MSLTESWALDRLEMVMHAAKLAGADAADALLVGSNSLRVSWRLGALEDIGRSESLEMDVRVFVGQSPATVSTSDLSPQAISAAVERAVAMARLAPPDIYAGLADPATLLQAPFPDLDLADTSSVGPDELKTLAAAAEDAARTVPGVTNSEGAEAAAGEALIALATSTGFRGAYRGTSYSLATAMIAQRDDMMERDSASHSVRHLPDLESPRSIGERAGARAVKRLGARKIPSSAMPILFDARVAGGLVGHYLSAISGTSIARRSSFLLDDLHKPVFAPQVTILEDPHRLRGLRSRGFDGEGMATVPLTLVDAGVVTTWLLDTASAKQLGLRSTGHAGRGIGGPPSPSVSNVHMVAGSESPEAMIKNINRGLYVIELIGSGVNGVTGDYSRGAVGFLIDHGELTHAVNEVTIAGNLRDMFAQLTPADDLSFRYAINAPTLRVEGMTVAGA